MVCPFAIGKLRRLRLPLPPKTHQIGVVEAVGWGLPHRLHCMGFDPWCSCWRAAPSICAEKDSRFWGAHADRRNENRFIFFSGVVAWTTPFSFGGQVGRAIGRSIVGNRIHDWPLSVLSCPKELCSAGRAICGSDSSVGRWSPVRRFRVAARPGGVARRRGRWGRADRDFRRRRGRP